MKISVVIPSYNRDSLLLNAIESVINQSYQPHEIIVVDDASHFDVNQMIVDKYQNTPFNKIIKVIVNPINLGGAESRNIGVSKAVGDYIAFLDSDDYWHPAKLQKQVEIIKQYPTTDVVYCDQWITGKQNQIITSHTFKLISENILEALFKGWLAPNTSTLLIKKDMLERVGGFDRLLSSCQDHDLWLKLAIYSAEFRYHPEKLCFFSRDADNRISHNHQKRVNGAKFFLKKWRKTIIEAKGYPHFCWFYLNYMLIVSYGIFLSMWNNREYCQALRVFIRNLLFNPLTYSKFLTKVVRRRS